ncbi:MAG: hypothetical protein IPM04_15350 [Saprospiraceae bacterium]|nr:hypothetical protein [Candidatus Brachybacter algidus]MBK8749137.1 hypothetical protein [Candidatus Brachybacter algidus]
MFDYEHLSIISVISEASFVRSEFSIVERTKSFLLTVTENGTVDVSIDRINASTD